MNKEDFDIIIENAEIKPQVLQVERHPYYTGKDIESRVKENDLKIMAWYPLGHRKTAAQIIVRWHLEIGNCISPGSKNIDHIKDNFNIKDPELKAMLESLRLLMRMNNNYES